MEKIQICSSCIVKPSRTNNSNSRRIELTPWELQSLLLDYAQRGLLFPKPAQDVLNNVIQSLKTSLSHTLDVFAPFAGRLGTMENDDGTTSFFLDCNNAGAKFVHARVQGVCIDYVNSVPTSVYSLFQMNGVRNYEGISEPLLAIQVTELTDGVFIGFSYNHIIADGTSFWHFVNTWSEVSRSSDHHHHQLLQSPLVMGNWFLGDIDKPIKIPFSVPDKLTPHPWQNRLFHISKEKVALLKARANKEIGNTTTKISSFQAILGHLWMSVVRNQNSDADQQVYFICAANMRQRLIPPLEDHYFGNVIMSGIVTATAGELLRRGLGWVSLQINKMVANQTNEEARRRLAAWVEKPFLPGIDHRGKNNVLMLASSPRFKVYENDFGWGRPSGARSGAGNNCVGMVTIFPGMEKDSVELHVSHLQETLQDLGKDAEFMESVST